MVLPALVGLKVIVKLATLLYKKTVVSFPNRTHKRKKPNKIKITKKEKKKKNKRGENDILTRKS